MEYADAHLKSIKARARRREDKTVGMIHLLQHAEVMPMCATCAMHNKPSKGKGKKKG